MSKIVVGDADALIALSLEKDPSHSKAVAIYYWLIQQDSMLVFPVSVFPESITTLKRALSQPEKAHALNQQFLAGVFMVEYIDAEIMKKAAEIFDKKAVSKQNTLFDAIVAATAEKLEADAIFSFDNWYPKLGFTLVESGFSR